MNTNTDRNINPSLITQETQNKQLMRLITKHSYPRRVKTNRRSAYQPSSRYLNEQLAIYEVLKDTYSSTHNRTLALDKAYIKSCLMKPQLNASKAQLFTPTYIHHMHLQLECDLGWCVDLCWKRLQLPH